MIPSIDDLKNSLNLASSAGAYYIANSVNVSSDNNYILNCSQASLSGGFTLINSYFSDFFSTFENSAGKLGGAIYC